jgi:hypothetical protein
MDLTTLTMVVMLALAAVDDDMVHGILRSQADQLHQQALGVAGSFENYAEIAALYFQLAWQDHQPVVRSKFANPAIVSFH